MPYFEMRELGGHQQKLEQRYYNARFIKRLDAHLMLL